MIDKEPSRGVLENFYRDVPARNFLVLSLIIGAIAIFFTFGMGLALIVGKPDLFLKCLVMTVVTGLLLITNLRLYKSKVKRI